MGVIGRAVELGGVDDWNTVGQAARRAGAARLTNEIGKSRRKAQKLPIGHFLGHIQNELAIFLVGLAQETAKLIEKPGFLAATAPGDVVGRLALGEIRQLGRFFTVVEELIEWAL